ncbi:MAG: GYD domain-containing protein [Dehalococcoidales bacterium]|nr:GYD domain-containing protein [Dehalococcoidales bacterium]
MAYYLMLTRLTDHGRKTIRSKPSRLKEVNREVEAMGVKIIAQYFLLGIYDFVNILSAPDNWNVSRVAMELGARGTLETITMPAMPIDEFIRYMETLDKYKKK